MKTLRIALLIFICFVTGVSVTAANPSIPTDVASTSFTFQGSLRNAAGPVTGICDVSSVCTTAPRAATKWAAICFRSAFHSPMAFSQPALTLAMSSMAALAGSRPRSVAPMGVEAIPFWPLAKLSLQRLMPC